MLLGNGILEDSTQLVSYRRCWSEFGLPVIGDGSQVRLSRHQKVGDDDAPFKIMMRFRDSR